MNAPAQTEGYDAAVDWLRLLNGEINEICHGTYRSPITGCIHKTSWDRRKRQLTHDEWKKVLQLVKEHELPVEVGCDSLTFTLKIYGYSNSLIREISPECVLFVHAQHLPGADPKRTSIEKNVEVLESLSWLVASERNKELLMWYGLEQTRAPNYYSYY